MSELRITNPGESALTVGDGASQPPVPPCPKCGATDRSHRQQIVSVNHGRRFARGEIRRCRCGCEWFAGDANYDVLTGGAL